MPLLLVSPSEARVLVHFVDLVLADLRLKGIRLQRYDDRLEMLADVLEQWGARRVGFEAEAVAHAEYLRWCERLADDAPHGVRCALAQLRERTDPVELMTFGAPPTWPTRRWRARCGNCGPVCRRARSPANWRASCSAAGPSGWHICWCNSANTAQPQARPGPTRRVR